MRFFLCKNPGKALISLYNIKAPRVFAIFYCKVQKHSTAARALKHCRKYETDMAEFKILKIFVHSFLYSDRIIIKQVLR